ncbi:unnamed protein product [Bursaphelenchus okinawaensis]|uniref:Lipoprotein receptor n=1 Tax=Bursaphelenchus okinawaensis TaxID=465554 RepID=A0A811LQ94_9BILA|nr:unnamed protein product [Bursaphelenchus okinawaensis]CAG9127016.1 unnamed protein product [Bursaphelenchus okinawaensis]
MKEECRPKPRGAPDEKFVRGDCPARQFECKDVFGNVRCALEQWLCDNRLDCADGIDEMYCDYDSNATTIEPDSDRTSGRHDSINKAPMSNKATGLGNAVSSHGKNTLKQATVPFSSTINCFKCHDGKCVDTSTLCDGKRDCDGGEDEQTCTTTVKGQFF